MPFEIFIIVVVSVVATFRFLTALVMSLHQQKMAELINKREGSNAEIAPLVNELVNLRERVERLNEKVNQQSIALDDLSSLDSHSSVSERLSPPELRADIK